MVFDIAPATPKLVEELVSIRLAAMKDSLQAIRRVKEAAVYTGLPIRLGALKQSESNNFYKNRGFVLTHQEEWDNYYEFSPLG